MSQPGPSRCQLLLLHQPDGERSASPFNFTCLLPNCGNYQRKKYWSCDKAFQTLSLPPSVMIPLRGINKRASCVQAQL